MTYSLSASEHFEQLGVPQEFKQKPTVPDRIPKEVRSSVKYQC